MQKARESPSQQPARRVSGRARLGNTLGLAGTGKRPFPIRRSAQTKARRNKQVNVAAGSEWGLAGGTWEYETPQSVVALFSAHLHRAASWVSPRN